MILCCDGASVIPSGRNGMFSGENLRQRLPLPTGHLSEEKTELWVCKGKTVLWPWCAPLLCRVYFVGLMLCNFYSPYWAFQYLFVFLFQILLSSESLGMDESKLDNQG